MSDGTAIEWTHRAGTKGETWNPVTGCDRVSPGCAHCYALTMAKRLKAMGSPHYQVDGDPRTSGPGFGVSIHPDALELPLRWRSPRTVFVNSMSDLFHEEIPDEFIARVFSVMGLAHRHTFQILTKRPERARAWFERTGRCELGWRTHDGTDPTSFGGTGEVLPDAWPLPNVWLGVSIENARYTWRADVLREIPAAVRFLSCEPLLGSLFEAAPWQPPEPHDWQPVLSNTASAGLNEKPGAYHCPRCGSYSPFITLGDCPGELGITKTKRPLDLTGIDWVIVGGESGPGARPMHPDWAREIRDAVLNVCGTCLSHEGVYPSCSQRPALFFKQWGEWVPHVRDGGGADWGVVKLSANRSTPEVQTLLPDGTRYDGRTAEQWFAGTTLGRIGKKKAGRILDGRTWDEFPARSLGS